MLQSPAAPSGQRHAADEWLLRFQSSYEAWQACTSFLLQCPADSDPSAAPPGLRLFLAQTLRKKCQQDMTSLPRDQWPALCDSLLAIAARPAPRDVTRYLAAALAAATAACVGWNDAVAAATSRLPLGAALAYLAALPEEGGGSTWGSGGNSGNGAADVPRLHLQIAFLRDGA